MEKKQRFFACVLGFVVSAGLGAGGMYLANFRKIDFMNRHTGFLQGEKFAKETLEIPLPESDKDNELTAYFGLYGDKYTRYGREDDVFSEKYILGEVNGSSCAELGGYRVNFNENEEPYFSAVVDGLPADKSGIKVGDIIKNINDFDLEEPRHVKRLNIKDGDPIKLILERDGQEIQINYTCHTDMTAEGYTTLEMYGNTLYASISSFDSDFLKQLEDAPEFDSIIIDLRQNGGGNPNTAINFANPFIGVSETVLHSYNGDTQTLKTDGDVKYDVPIVVLIDEKTASAAEILTALLKQYGNAELVGMNTLGKGIFQSSAFINQNTLIYTEGYYTVGDWECYQGIGIKPDVEIDMSPKYIGTDKDIQLEKAFEVIKDKVRG